MNIDWKEALPMLLFGAASWIAGHYSSAVRKKLMDGVHRFVKRLGMRGFQKLASAMEKDARQHRELVERASKDYSFAAVLMGGATFWLVRGLVLMFAGFGIMVYAVTTVALHSPGAWVLVWFWLLFGAVCCFRGVAFFADGNMLRQAAAEACALPGTKPLKWVQTKGDSPA